MKTRSETTAGWLRPQPRAEPMNGAVQGVATTVARAPPQKEDWSPSLPVARFAGRDERLAHLEDPEEVQAEHEEEHGEDHDEGGRLELEPPPDALARRRGGRGAPRRAPRRRRERPP